MVCGLTRFFRQRRHAFPGLLRMLFDQRMDSEASHGSTTAVQENKDVLRSACDQGSQNGHRSRPQRAISVWERQAEENAVERLQKIGLLAPSGEVDKVLETIVNNLIVTNNLTALPDIHCRVLLTEPFESFTIGRSIVVSRGLLDVLPDEASLAMVLAHELSHIVLGHPFDAKLAFNDRLFFPDEESFHRLDLDRSAADEAAAGTTAGNRLKHRP